MKLKDLMTTELATLTPDCTVLDAAKTMQAHNIGIIPICEDGDKLKGIVTDRDIVVRNIAHDGDPGSTKLKDLMSYELVTATPTMSARGSKAYGTAQDTPTTCCGRRQDCRYDIHRDLATHKKPQ